MKSRYAQLMPKWIPADVALSDLQEVLKKIRGLPNAFENSGQDIGFP